MKIYDDIIRKYHELRGTDVSKFRRQWIVTDVQKDAGSLHSGYPIVTGLDVLNPHSDAFMLDAKKLKQNGHWGIFHEIGHNMQQPEWKFDGTSEVTCNVFTLCAMDVICGLGPWIHPWLEVYWNDAVEYLKGEAPYEQWKKKPGVALFIYAQLAREFGWNVYKKVLQRYQAMPKEDIPKTDQEKIDKWFETFSEVSGKNLIPLVTFWGIPLSDAAKERVENLKLPRFSCGR